MKKLMAIMMTLAIMIMVSNVYAETDVYPDDANEILDEYLMKNGIKELYNNTMDDYGIFGMTATASVHYMAYTYGEPNGSIIKWFRKILLNSLNEEHPDAETAVYITEFDEYEGIIIYKCTVASTTDLIDYYEGDQYIVDIMMTFID